MYLELLSLKMDEKQKDREEALKTVKFNRTIKEETWREQVEASRRSLKALEKAQMLEEAMLDMALEKLEEAEFEADAIDNAKKRKNEDKD